MFDVIDFNDVPDFEFNDEGVLVFSDESNVEITDLMRGMMGEVGIFLTYKISYWIPADSADKR